MRKAVRSRPISWLNAADAATVEKLAECQDLPVLNPLTWFTTLIT